MAYEKNKFQALAQELGLRVDDIETADGETFTASEHEYLVLTDTEANTKATENIKESAWAFNADFIIEHSKLPYGASDMVKAYQEKECENANEAVLALIEDIDEFVEDAIKADGRGHFLSGYDGKECEQAVEGVEYYIYKQ